MTANLLEYVMLPEAVRAGTAAPPAPSDDERVEVIVRRGDGTSESLVLPRRSRGRSAPSSTASTPAARWRFWAGTRSLPAR